MNYDSYSSVPINYQIDGNKAHKKILFDKLDVNKLCKFLLIDQ